MMPSPPQRSAGALVVRLLLGVLLVSLLAAPVAARERGEAEEGLFGGFSPYVWAGPYTTIQSAKASVDTDFGPSDKAKNTLTNLGWLFALGVQSPAIEAIPGRPRIDVGGGLLVPTNQSSAIGSRVELITGTFLDKTREETKLQLDYSNSYRASLALEFRIVDLLPVDFTVAPGLQYLYLDSRWDGFAESERTFPGGQQDPILRGASSKVNFVQQLLGPSLRLTTDSADVFGIDVAVFAEGALLFDLQGTRRTRSVRDDDNRRSTFNWETGTTAGVVTFGVRLQLP